MFMRYKNPIFLRNCYFGTLKKTHTHTLTSRYEDKRWRMSRISSVSDHFTVHRMVMTVAKKKDMKEKSCKKHANERRNRLSQWGAEHVGRFIANINTIVSECPGLGACMKTVRFENWIRASKPELNLCPEYWSQPKKNVKTVKLASGWKSTCFWVHCPKKCS